MPEAVTAGGLLPVLAVLLPVTCATLALPLGARGAERLALAALPAGLLLALAIAAALLRGGVPLVAHLGGWAPPLGLALRADGLAAAMLLATALVTGGVALAARRRFGTPAGTPERRAALSFWTLLFGLWAAMNGVLVAGDLFTLFIALEFLTFAAVPLVCLDGRKEALAAALRYLTFVLLGSALYLLGVALLFGAYGTLDLPLLAQRVRPGPVTLAAAALMTAGLLAKTALLPLHLWLPPAHAGAPAEASALLSALAIKASFVLLLRLWFGILPGLPGVEAVSQLLAGLGAAAILLGSVAALRQARLKMLVAYSTVAQIGYLFLPFPLLAASAALPDHGAGAWLGAVLQASSHAFAKAAMFLAAGQVALACGHDRIAGLSGVARRLPVGMVAFGLGALSLMGIPPTGGFAAKWLLLTSALELGQWWWAAVILGGGLLTGGYVWRVLVGTLSAAGEDSPDGQGAAPPGSPVANVTELVALGLALLALVIGLLPLGTLGLVQVGRPGVP